MATAADQQADTMHDQFLIRTLIENAKRLGMSWSLRPATVVSSSAVAATAPRVIVDGDTAQVRPISLVGPLHPNQRVMVMTTPPSGLHVIGRIGDFGWKDMSLQNGWVVRPGYQGAKYRLMEYPSNHVEIVANLVFGSVVNGVLICTLPVGYRPVSVARISMGGGTAGGGALSGSCEISPNGEVRMWDYTSGSWCQGINGTFPLDL